MGLENIRANKYMVKRNGNLHPRNEKGARASIEAWGRLLVHRIGLYKPARFP